MANLIKLDRDFERLLSDLSRDIDRGEFTPEKRDARRKLADASRLEFCRIYYPSIFDMPFNDVHRHIASLEHGFHTVSGFPKSGKTAFAVIALLVREMAMGNGGMLNITLRTQIIALERSAQIYRLLTENRLLAYDYDINVVQSTKGYYIVNNTTLVATSKETGLRNFVDDDFKRFRISLADDVYNRISVRSEVDNDQVASFITGELYRQMEDDGLSIFLGNRISDDCPIERVREIYPENHFSFPILDEDGQPNWPEKYPLEDIPALKAKYALDVWEGEFMDRPFVRGEIFDPDWFRFININTVSLSFTLSAIDPSHGTSPSACFKAIATGGLTNKGELVVTDIYMRTEGYPLVFDYVHRLRLSQPNWKVLLFEDDFNQWGFAHPYYEDWSKSRKLRLPIIKHSAKSLKTDAHGADKDSRIISTAHPHQTGQILYDSRLKESREYQLHFRQYMSFGAVKTKLDGPDSLATLFIMAPRYSQRGSFKPLKERRFPKRFLGFGK